MIRIVIILWLSLGAVQSAILKTDWIGLTEEQRHQFLRLCHGTRMWPQAERYSALFDEFNYLIRVVNVNSGETIKTTFCNWQPTPIFSEVTTKRPTDAKGSQTTSSVTDHVRPVSDQSSAIERGTTTTLLKTSPVTEHDRADRSSVSSLPEGRTTSDWLKAETAISTSDSFSLGPFSTERSRPSSDWAPRSENVDRRASLDRKTTESEVRIDLDVEGSGRGGDWLKEVFGYIGAIVGTALATVFLICIHRIATSAWRAGIKCGFCTVQEATQGQEVRKFNSIKFENFSFVILEAQS